jgi:hypothetical protein
MIGTSTHYSGNEPKRYGVGVFEVDGVFEVESQGDKRHRSLTSFAEKPLAGLTVRP